MPNHPEGSMPVPGDWMEKPAREALGRRYQRFVIRTHLVQQGEQLAKTLMPYLEGRVARGDIVVLGEKIVSIAEGRAVRLDTIKPSKMAKFLAKNVRQLGYGMGLRRPETMEMAIREVGAGRILLAAVAGAADRVLGRSGDFYRIAGRQVAAIDGPGPTTIAPYNQYVVLSPAHPEAIAEKLSRRLHVCVAIVDVNDVGSEVLGMSQGCNKRLVAELLRDNPMGQGSQQTPLGVLRPIRDVRPKYPWPTTNAAEDTGGAVFAVPGAGDGSTRWAEEEAVSAKND